MQIWIIILLCIIAVILCIYYYRKYKEWKVVKESKEWPPEISSCPSYWSEVGENKCRNDFNIGSCGSNKEIVDFNTPTYNNKDKGNYNKCLWSKKCNAPWIGIDNLCN